MGSQAHTETPLTRRALSRKRTGGGMNTPIADQSAHVLQAWINYVIAAAAFDFHQENSQPRDVALLRYAAKAGRALDELIASGAINADGGLEVALAEHEHDLLQALYSLEWKHLQAQTQGGTA